VDVTGGGDGEGDTFEVDGCACTSGETDVGEECSILWAS